MLSVKELTKSYKTKGGVVTKALDGVSIDFPERGMVFILGKSGSGKSTLLNVTGGLDRPDSGEIIVKGKSSKDFSASDFDSYRNTFIGFIFQEYNILNEFNVEQNIALALQLQGKKNDKEAVNALLEQVDLVGYGHRKPNTLSGGQKQRVAIARALIKDPEIIMADEPTGALDSKTGKDVMDTLKKLSREKLVIVVSHDLDFAEQYGDRIVEMKDGKIISDVTKNYAAARALSANVSVIADDTLRVRGGTRLTDAELEKIRAMIEHAPAGSETIISADERKVDSFKRANNISADGSSEYFAATKPSDIQTVGYDGRQTKFIKSRLPMGHALRMGASGLKTKPVRLILTIFISILAFGLFGVMSTMMMYDMNYSVAVALDGSSYTSFILQKEYDITYTNRSINYYDGEVHESSYSDVNTRPAKITADELADYSAGAQDIKFAGIWYQDYMNCNNLNGNTMSSYWSHTPIGFTDVGSEFLTENVGGEYILAGTAPEKANEVAISRYMYDVIIESNGLREPNDWSVVDDPDMSYEDLRYEPGENVTVDGEVDENVIGKYISFYSSSGDITLKITAVYNVGEIPSEYDSLKESDGMGGGQQGETSGDGGIDMDHYMRTDLNSLLYVSPVFADEYPEFTDFNGYYDDSNAYINDVYYYIGFIPSDFYSDQMSVIFPSMLDDAYKFYSFDTCGEVTDPTVGSRQVYINADDFSQMARYLYDAPAPVFNPDYPEEVLYYDNYCNQNLNEEERISFENVLNNYYDSTPDEEDIEFVLNRLKTDWDEYVVNGHWEEYGITYEFLPYDKLYINTSEPDDSNALTILGVFYCSERSYGYVMSRETFEDIGETCGSYYIGETIIESDYVPPADGRYSALIANVESASYDALMYMLDLSEDGTNMVMLNNTSYNDAASAARMFDDMSFVFAIIGAVLAVISALLLFNYISVSISDKRKEIGILRAVGARGSDVFKIFICESLMIAIICGVLAIVAAIVACFIINTVTASSAIAIQLLNFGLINGLIVLGIALVVAFIGTILPVFFAARKVPVESIRAL